MEKKKYLETVTEQVRYVKARPMITKELEDHIEDQREAYMMDGITEAEAYEKAVAEMGDPVDVGVAMDKIHRPKMDWKMVLFVIGLSLFGLLLQYAMLGDLGDESYSYNIETQFICCGAGLLVMLFFCFFDYSRIGLYGKVGAIALLLLVIYSSNYGDTINGLSGYIRFPGFTVSMHQLIYLYVPCFGGILYSYKNAGKLGFMKCFVWIVTPVILVFRMYNKIVAICLLMIMLLQMCFVIKKGWFQSCKKSLAVVVSLIIGLPVLMALYIMLFSAGYQRARFMALYDMSSHRNYQRNTARELMTGSKLIGKSITGDNMGLAETPTYYVLTYVFSYYGILAALMLITVLFLFLFKIFKVSTRQKNQLGMVIGMGCSLVFGLQIILYILLNLTLIPPISVLLPFISFGGNGVIISYALIGILLSIYRYQNVLPINPIKKSVKNLIA